MQEKNTDSNDTGIIILLASEVGEAGQAEWVGKGDCTERVGKLKQAETVGELN